ncbi:ATP phosphoribosyltransferase [Microlunatus elymi]|uniref:ATP phosphoribosyltransferase n=1 Tax=Microlunatus elymi TaxID=2596828 RepID=A0A516Q604_9ACTN|nr:ATP phosphoribosyltransferase [Microlunatus elymi]
MLRIAVPNKGSLSEGAAGILREAGYSQRSDSKQLVHLDDQNCFEFFYLRPNDIATYVGEGTVDAGITGRDMLIESGAAADEVLGLGFARSRFRFAAPAGSGLTEDQLDGVRLATSYPGLVEGHLAARGIKPRLIHLDGAVEVAIRLGVADVIADVVSTGTTLRQAGLEVFGDPILTSEAILIKPAGRNVPDGFDNLVRRLNGVLIARTYVMMDYDVDQDHLDQACELTPGFEAPTVSPLARQGWFAVRAMVRRKQAQQVMDDLWEAGARAILVTDIAASRL